MKKTLMILVLLASAALVFAAGQPQVSCPVMEGNPINKSVYVDADGYRIYLCCQGCVNAVKAEPAKYIAAMQAAGIELEKAPQPE